MRPCRHGRDGLPHDMECRVCYLDAHDAKYARLWAAMTPGVPTLKTCRHRGPLIPLAERYKLNLGVLRDWHKCAKNHGTDGYVCPCQGCNPNCTDYECSTE